MIKSKKLSKFKQINHGFFDKKGGKSTGIYKSLNCGIGSYDSKKNVLRGIHIQTKNGQGKYVAVVKGAILDVVVDLRKNSKTFSKHYKTVISDKNNKSIYIPPGFAHGFLGLKKENIIYYLNTQYQNKKSAIGIVWNDKDLNIKWPRKKPTLSKKDKLNLSLKEYLSSNAK